MWFLPACWLPLLGAWLLPQQQLALGFNWPHAQVPRALCVPHGSVQRQREGGTAAAAAAAASPTLHSGGPLHDPPPHLLPRAASVTASKAATGCARPLTHLPHPPTHPPHLFVQDFAGSGRSVHGMLRIMSEYTELTSPGGLKELVKGLKLPRV